MDISPSWYLYHDSLCKALIKSMQERFGGLFKQLGLPVDGIAKSRGTSELFSDSLFLMAPFLDARFGLRWVNCSKLSEDTKSRVCETIKRSIASAVLELHGSDRSQNMGNASETPVVATSNGVISNLKLKTLFAFPKDDESLVKRKRSNILEQIEEELPLFSREALDDSTLIFKKANSYPCLSLLARRILCVPATSAPVEREFSTSGFIIRPHRGGLLREMLAKLTFLKCNSTFLH